MGKKEKLMKKKLWILCALALALLLTGCGSGDNEAASTEPKAEKKVKVNQEITIFR